MPERGATVGRGLWSGTISFGLVSVPVELFSATRRASISLRMLGPDGTPLTRQYVCPKDETVLDAGDIERGVEVEDDEWVIVTDEELEKVAPRRSRDISLERFVLRDDGLATERVSFFDSQPLGLQMLSRPRGWLQLARSGFRPQLRARPPGRASWSRTHRTRERRS